MKKLKIFNYLILLFAVPLLALTCDPPPDRDPYPCVAMKRIFYTWDSIYTENLDNGGRTAIISTTNSIPKSAYGIRLTFRQPPMSLVRTVNDTCIFLSPTDTIVDMKIYTLYDFDASHLAGSEITEYFRVALKIAYNDYSYSDFKTVPEVMNPNGGDYGQLDFLLFQAPQMNTNHEFRIDIKKYDGTIVPIPVPPVTLY